MIPLKKGSLGANWLYSFSANHPWNTAFWTRDDEMPIHPTAIIAQIDASVTDLFPTAFNGVAPVLPNPEFRERKGLGDIRQLRPEFFFFGTHIVSDEPKSIEAVMRRS